MSVPFAGVCLVLVAAIVAYWPTVASLLRFWNDYDNLSYTHGYLVAAICVWLLWRARHSIADSVGGFSPAGLAVLVLCSVAWFVAYLAGIEVGHQALLPLLLLAAVAAFCGFTAAVRAALPVCFLYFAIPVWDQINGLLQQLTIVAVTAILKLLAIPARFDGSFVHLGSGSFEIAGGCSGLHFFIVALAISVLFGELGHDSLRTRAKLVLIAGGMAIVMNWVRVATIIISGYLTDMQSFLVKVDHYYFGWALFGVLLLIFYWGVPRWLKLKSNPAPQRSANPAAPRTTTQYAVAGVVTLVALFIPPVVASRVQASAVVEAGSVELSAPVPSTWEGPLAPDTPWNPRFPAADQVSRAAYVRNGARVESFSALYAYQAQGRELVGYGNDVLGSGGRWKLERKDRLPASAAGATALNRTIATHADGTTWVVLHRYEVGGRSFTDGLASKLYYPIALLHGAAVSSVVAAAARCDGDCERATHTAVEFMDSTQRKDSR